MWSYHHQLMALPAEGSMNCAQMPGAKDAALDVLRVDAVRRVAPELADEVRLAELREVLV